MHRKKQNYLKILKIELEDLKSDIAFMIKGIEEGKTSGNISNYVFLENLSVLNTELLGVDTFEELLSQLKTDDFETLADLVTYLQNKVKDEVEKKELPPAMFNLINRKLLKVSDYIEHTSES